MATITTTQAGSLTAGATYEEEPHQLMATQL